VNTLARSSTQRSRRFSTEEKAEMQNVKARVLEQPLLSLWRQGDDVVCQICSPANYSFEAYGILVCNLVRHVAEAFEVNESDVWEWVDKERFHPTLR
jgi:hypothetical protein